RSSELVQASRAGPTQAGPGQGRAGRTRAKRAHTGSPSKGSTTAQNPSLSRAARSEVTSTSSVASRPPTTARGCSGSIGAGTPGSVRSRGGAPGPGRRERDAVHVEFTEEQEALRRVVREFAEGEIAPHAAEWDRDHRFPVDVVRQMGELGLFGIPFPARYGGGDGDLTTLCIAIEELARVDQSIAITLEA